MKMSVLSYKAVFNYMLRWRAILYGAFSSFLHSHRSWSQEGEDQILRRIFEGQSKGFYIDVGAHHPTRFSNTFFFYLQGWTGVNIDACPGSMSRFRRVRPRDVNLELGIGEVEADRDFYVFNEPALNSFSRSLSLHRHESSSPYFIKKLARVKIFPLRDVLRRFVSEDQSIDFLSVDVEGNDLAVLKSNDWVRFRPLFVLVEQLGDNAVNVIDGPVGRFLSDNGYFFFAKTVNTVFFKDSMGS